MCAYVRTETHLFIEWKTGFTGNGKKVKMKEMRKSK